MPFPPNRTACRRALGALAIAAAAGLGVDGARAQSGSLPTADVTLPASPSAEAAQKINEALRHGDGAAALEAADAFLQDHPRDAQVRFLRAVALGDLGRRDDAVSALESITQDYPELPEPYNNLAVLRAAQGELAAAEHLLQQAIAAQPDYATAHENLGDLYVAMAVAAYERATRLEPANAGALRKLSIARDLGGKLRASP